MSTRTSGGERHGSRRRQEIFDIATRLFSDKGYGRTSTKDIADAAGILKGSLYAHVESKEDILLAVVEDIHARFDANRAACERLDARPYERLRAFLDGHVQVALSALEYHRIYSRDWTTLSPERYRVIRKRRDAYEEYLADLIAAAQAEGRVRDDVDPRLLSITVLAMLNSLHTWFKPGRAFTAAEVTAAYLGVVLTGTATATGPPPHDPCP